MIKMLETGWIHYKNAFLNILFVLWIKFRELFQFGLQWWWWKMHVLAGFLYVTDSCYRVAKRESDNVDDYSFLNFGYGETPASTLKKILDPVKPKDYGLFIDLGSGRGFAVLEAYFMYRIRTIGVEILPSHCNRSRKLAEMMDADGVEIVSQDILDFDFSQKAIYFSATTSFEGRLLKGLEEKLKETPVDSVIILIHKPLEGEEFELLHKEIMPFTWGNDYVYFYRRTLA